MLKIHITLDDKQYNIKFLKQGMMVQVGGYLLYDYIIIHIINIIKSGFEYLKNYL